MKPVRGEPNTGHASSSIISQSFQCEEAKLNAFHRTIAATYFSFARRIIIPIIL